MQPRCNTERRLQVARKSDGAEGRSDSLPTNANSASGNLTSLDEA